MAKYLSEQQVKDLRTAFDLFDKNKDGHISAEELGNVLRAMGQTPTDQDIKDIIREADTDKNGSIEFEEFKTIISKKMKPEISEDELREAFKVFDRDNSGKISVEELRWAMANLGEKMTNEQIDDMMKVADKNKDGHIDYSEFCRWMMSI